jgi:hypothetical protein
MMSASELCGALVMRAQAGRLCDYAAAETDQTKVFDLESAGELITHLESLTITLAKATGVPLHSGRRP